MGYENSTTKNRYRSVGTGVLLRKTGRLGPKEPDAFGAIRFSASDAEILSRELAEFAKTAVANEYFSLKLAGWEKEGRDGNTFYSLGMQIDSKRKTEIRELNNRINGDEKNERERF